MKPFIASIFFLLCCTCAWPKSDPPVFTINSGYEYLNAGQNGAPRASLNGFYITPQYHFNANWSGIAEYTDTYGTPQGKSTNIQSYTAGPVYGFATHTALTPFVLGEIGDVRVSAAGTVSNTFGFVAAVGANIKMCKHVALQIIPVNYILTTPSKGALNSYAFQTGLAFSFGHK